MSTKIIGFFIIIPLPPSICITITIIFLLSTPAP
jgi:hypothetical protein